VEAAVPARQTTAAAERAVERAVLLHRDRLESFVDVATLPRHAERAIEPHPERLGSHDERRRAHADAIRLLHLANERFDARTSGARRLSHCSTEYLQWHARGSDDRNARDGATVR